MKKIILGVIGVICLSTSLSACGSGGDSSSGGYSGSFVDNPVPPNPTPEPGTYEYNGQQVSYESLPQPSQYFANTYPESYFPTNLSPYSLQIAYGRTDESSIGMISAFVTMTNSVGQYICSATPVYYDSVSNSTFLIGAAHCFAQKKSISTSMLASDLFSTSGIKVYLGKPNQVPTYNYPVSAVYLMKNYCYNATFPNGQSCPNFTPYQGANNGQGNDLSIIQVQGKFGSPESYPYPQVAPASQYPETYTMAPILSIGYGINTQQPNSNAGCAQNGSNCQVMYYVAGYQYWQQDATLDENNNGGYHYLYNSYYNFGYQGQTGYTALICGGDSGGPDLFWAGNHWILLSEHTYGPSNACGTFYSYLPNGATNVSAYYNWIMSILNYSDPNNRVSACKNGTIANCVTNG